MSKINYICMSDLHFGADNSLLTNLDTANSKTDPSKPSPVLKHLVKCLEFFVNEFNGGEKPVLVLGGDVMELALSTTNEAAMVFERFIELVMPENNELFSDIIYIPGNHDHHLWETARETQYAEHLKTLDTDAILPVPWHTTHMITPKDKLVPSYFLTRLVRRYPHLQKLSITTSYPNLGVFNKESKRLLVISHGHYIEQFYMLISMLRTMIFPDTKMPLEAWDIEAENFAWVDFFWSTMGRSGDAGQDIEIIYDKSRNPKELKKLLHNLAHSIAKRYGKEGWLIDKIEEKTLDFLFDRLADSIARERDRVEGVLSKDSSKGLGFYMEEPVRRQALRELKKQSGAKLKKDGEDIPFETTFVFGHTHKPFSEDRAFNGFQHWVHVYNSGGWVVDTVETNKYHGGAIVLVDAKLNTASVRMYNEAEDPGDYAVRVEQASPGVKSNNALYDELKKAVKPADDPWNSFSEETAVTVKKREKVLEKKINSAT